MDADQVLHDEQSRCLRHHLSAAPQDDHTLLVIPIVQNELQYQRVSTGRDRFEERAGDEAATVTHAGRIEHAGGSPDDVRSTEEDAVQRGIQLQYARQEIARATADIDETSGGRKVAVVAKGCQHRALEIGSDAIEAFV